MTGWPPRCSVWMSGTASCALRKARRGGRGSVSVTVFAVAALAICGAVFALSWRWTVSAIAGVVLGLEVAWLALVARKAFVENRIRNRSGR